MAQIGHNKGMSQLEEFQPSSDTPPIDSFGATPPAQPSAPLWLHFPRRVVLLIAACAIAIFLLQTLPTPLGLTGAPGDAGSGLLSAPVLERLPNSLLLLTTAYLFALTLAALLAAIGALIAALAARGPGGGVLAALGRLALYIWMPLPVAAAAFALFLLLSGPPGAPVTLIGDNASTLIVGALLIALYPALLAAMDAVRAAAAPVGGAGRRFLAGLLQLLQSLALQMGGFLGGLLIVELFFARPGIGRLLLDGIIRREMGLAIDVVVLMALLILPARLLAELLGWALRFLQREEAPRAAESGEGRRLWPVFAALLLIIPLAIALGGLLTPAEAALESDLQQRLAEPSPRHPLGTDTLGRDNWARLRLGALGTLGRASLAGGALLLPALVLGALSGALWRRGGALAESASDLLLFPLDALLFMPLLPAAALLTAIAGPGSSVLVAALALLFLPRAARTVRDFWRERDAGGVLRFVLPTLATLFLLLLFHGFVASFHLEYMGLGPAPPTPSAGFIFTEAQQMLRAAPGATGVFVLFIAVLSFGLFTPAAALSGLSGARRPLSRLNE